MMYRSNALTMPPGASALLPSACLFAFRATSVCVQATVGRYGAAQAKADQNNAPRRYVGICPRPISPNSDVSLRTRAWPPYWRNACTSFRSVWLATYGDRERLGDTKAPRPQTAAFG